MREEAEDLKNALIQKFGAAVDFSYVDVFSEEMKKYPDILKILDKVRLPLIVLNGQPRFHGGFSLNMIAGAISGLLR